MHVDWLKLLLCTVFFFNILIHLCSPNLGSYVDQRNKYNNDFNACRLTIEIKPPSEVFEYSKHNIKH